MRVTSANRRSGRWASHGVAVHGTPDPSKRTRDRNVGKDGYVECPRCGKWCKPTPTGGLYSHRMPVSGLPCQVPAKTGEFVLLGDCWECGMRLPLQWRRLPGQHIQRLVLMEHQCPAAPLHYTLIEEEF